MAIVKMSEFNLYLLNDDLEEVLKKIQAFGRLNFKDISHEEEVPFLAARTHYDFEKNQYQQEHIQSVLSSIERFEKSRGRDKERTLGVINMSFDELEQRAANIDIEQLLDTYDENYDADQQVIGDFKVHAPWHKRRVDITDLEALMQAEIMIGTIEKKDQKVFEKELAKMKNLYFMAGEKQEQAVYVFSVLNSNMEQLDIAMEKAEMEARSARSLHIENEVREMEEKLARFAEKRKGLKERYGNIGHFKEELKIYYEFLRNEELRYQTIENFIQSDHVSIASGWIETDLADDFSAMIAEATQGISFVEFEEAALESKDVPVQLRNRKFIQPFELITNMYSQPRYHELDPTPLLTPFYALFFGMMLADVGYGALMGIVAFIALRVVNMKQSTETMIRFLLYLSIPTMVWGFIYGSFFGGLIPIEGWIDINRDFNFVMVLSIAFGIIHLFFGLGIKAYLFFRDRKPWDVLFDVVFWYLALTGAIVLVSGMFTQALSAYNDIAWIMMLGGMVGIVFTNGREAKTIFGKFASGLYSLYGITNYVGDVVSYTRLMALGLAGASIGMAFNMIVEMLSKMGVLGVVGASLVFVIGHGFNMFISGLSAYVHSARLTYVEFFGKFYTGGGKPFVSFRAKPTYIEIQ